MIVDTSVVLAAVERRVPEAIAAIERLPARSTRSIIVSGELEFGLRSAQRSGDPTIVELRRRSRDFYRLISEPGDGPALELLAEWFGEVSAIAQANGIRIGQNDRWILAEARCWLTTVLTADTTMHRLGVAVDDALPSASPISELVRID